MPGYEEVSVTWKCLLSNWVTDQIFSPHTSWVVTLRVAGLHSVCVSLR